MGDGTAGGGPRGERELQRLSRLYSAQSHVSQMILRMPARAELFQRTCEVLREQAQFRMSWIGWHEPESHRLVPVASAGDDVDYLAQITVYGDDRPEGRGPAGTGFRTQRPCVVNDLLGDPSSLPWRTELERSGFRSTAVFPIRERGEVGGVLIVYADERGFFRDREVALLTEVAADVSFGLDNLARDASRRRAEHALAHFRAIVESSDDAIVSRTLDGRICSWNAAAERMFGHSASDAIGRPITVIIPPERAGEEQIIQREIEGGVHRGHHETVRISKTGTRIPVAITFSPIWDVDSAGEKTMVGVSKILRDLSERRQAEAALRTSEVRHRTTLDSILEACQLIGFDWRYLYLNDAAAVVNRRPNSELLGRTMMEARPDIEQAPVFAMLRRCMEERIAVNGEIEFHFVDGTQRWFEVRCQPVPEGIFVLMLDLTERKQAELSLRELNASLEQKIFERTRDLEAAKERAESADRLKSAFVATMSHELRTPLNSILGFTGIVLQGLAGPLGAEQTKQLGMVQSSGRHLLELINDVLDISKIAAGQVELRVAPFELGTSIDRVIELVRPLADTKGLTLQVDQAPGPVSMESDQRRVEQILINLLSNAIKFTDRGSVRITVSRLDDDEAGTHGPGVRCRVEDTGIGIAPAEVAKLFQPFSKLDVGVGGHREGTGLGLSICRSLITLLGGVISVESVPDQGSVFTFTLPVHSRDHLPPRSTGLA